MNNPSQPFVILGHGAEDITKGFESRAILEEGYTIVTLAECGVVTEVPLVNKFLDAFTDPANRELFANPASPTNKAIIQKLICNDIHVYKAGNRYPDLTVQTLVDWKKENEVNRKSSLSLFKSGLYPFPIAPIPDDESRVKTYNVSDENSSSFHMMNYLPQSMRDSIIQLYNGSIFPTQEHVTQTLAENTIPSGRIKFGQLKRALRFPLSHIMEIGGPGVYYYIICRSPKGVDVQDWVECYISPKTDEKKALIQRFKTNANIIPLIPKILGNAEALKEEELARLKEPSAKPGWNSNIIIESHNKFKKLYNEAMRTRRLSIAQQAAINAAEVVAEGGGRRHKTLHRNNKKYARRTQRQRR